MTDINSNPLPSPEKQPTDFFRELDIQLLIHELKGPLSVIENNNRMLLEHQRKLGPLTETQQQALKRSLRCSAKLRDLIHTLLEVGASQCGSIHPTRFDVAATVKKIIVDVLKTEFSQLTDEPDADRDGLNRQAAFILKCGIILDISPDIEGTVLQQDQIKFGQIMNNLVRNALQHKNSQVDIHVAIKRSNLQIRVSDDGEGIAPEDKAELFQCYAKKKSCRIKARAVGHGLGLAGSRILARRIGGDITIDTRFKTGSSFILRLPTTLPC
jgi:signal transduction histidine kinase